MIKVACGFNNTAIICNDGTNINKLYTCGQNNVGQLGLGDYNNHYTFVQVTIGIPQNISVQDVSCSNHMIVLMKDGTIWTCGDNAYGNLGLETIGGTESILKKVPDMKPVVKIYASYPVTSLLLNNGTLWSCGKNTNGNLGFGTQTNAEPKFKKITFGITDKVISMTCGIYASNVLLKNGHVLTTGINKHGVLGQGMLNSNYISTTFTKTLCIINQSATTNTSASLLYD